MGSRARHSRAFPGPRARLACDEVRFEAPSHIGRRLPTVLNMQVHHNRLLETLATQDAPIVADRADTGSSRPGHARTDPWAPRPRVDNTMVKALARAFRWRKMLDAARTRRWRSLARARGVDATQFRLRSD